MKKILLIIMVAALLTITACGEGETVNTGATGFVGGTQGIQMKFMTNTPPAMVEGAGIESFDVIVELENKGEYEVLKEDITVKLEGFSATAFNTTNEALTQNPEDDLFAVRKNADGTIISSPPIPAMFENLNYQDTVMANMPFTIRAKACYGYETTALSNICVKENFNDDRPGDICAVMGTKTVSNSGAPVQVTHIRQSPVGRDKTTITFGIQKRDTNPSGKVSRIGSDCGTASTQENMVFVTLSGFEGPGNEVRCIGLTDGTGTSGYVRLNEGQPREISCTIILTDRNPRVQPFSIRVGYDYSTYIDKQLIVTHTPE